ncbi:hypothetical protein [Paenibacillus alba]|uniref:7TM-DISM receptor extracellular domain-containing protein n=1 Tax=Paenibacillus alba TaxID=1197127 RepID=A0ABU6G250_9BACL|nr:hypothetical protein [Paenibacillus alba]MEC0228245.1 hypothetical protein [Paenibacillus alba]
MKLIFQMVMKYLLVAMIGFGIVVPQVYAETPKEKLTIPDWSIMWGNPQGGIEEVRTDPSKEWITVKNGKTSPEKPAEVSSAWIKFQLPAQIPIDYGIYIQGIHAQNIWIYMDDHLIQEISFDFAFDKQRVLFPIGNEEAGKVVYVKLETSMGRLDIHSAIMLDNYTVLTRAFLLYDFLNIILGCVFLFIALIIPIGSLCLRKGRDASWVLISVLNLTLGIIFITYSSFIYINFTNHGGLYITLFDLSLAVFLPTLTYYFEKTFADGKYKLIRWFRKFQVVYSVFLIIIMLINQFYGSRFSEAYFFASVTVLGYIMICQFILMCYC